jgi:hypothetical protein
MERGSWTDDRLDERMAAMEEKFDRLFEELRDVRGEIAALRADFSAFQRQVVVILAGLAVGQLGLLGAFVAAQA